MSIAYPQHIHTVLFTITLPSTLTLLFIYASFTQCDIFSQLLHNWLYNNVYSISATYTYSIVYNYSPQYTGFAVYICFLYTMWHFFTITAQLTLQQCLQHILNIYIRYCLQLHYPVYWLCCLYMLPLHNVTFFHNYCTSDSTTMSTAYSQHIHTVLSQLHYPVYWLCCLHMLYFSQYDIFSQLLHNWLYNNVYSISSTYTYDIVYNYTTQYTDFAVYICCPFHNVIFFLNYCTIDSTTMSTAYPQHIRTVLLQLHYPVNWLCCLYMLPLHNVTFFHNYCPIDSTTMSTAYPQHIHIVLFATTPHSILALLFIYAFLFTMWYFSTMTAQFTLQQCLQHILNISIQYCSQLHYPVYWLCCLHMLSFSQCDIFPQWLHNSLYNNVYSISSTYTYGTVYNYTTQYTVFAITYAILFTIWYFFTITAQLTLQQCLQYILNIYIRYCLQLHYPVYWLCCLYMLPLHNVTFFHNYCTSDSTTMSTAYPQHIHIVLFTNTLHSILALLFLYAYLFTMCYFSSITA